MQKGWITALAVLIGLMLTGCGQRSGAPSETPSQTQTPPKVSAAPSLPPKPQTRFHIRDLDRRETLLEFSGRDARFHRIAQPIVLLYLFSKDCSPCRGMLPDLGTLQQKNRKSLFVIGILLGETPEPLRRFMRRYSTDFFLSVHPDNSALARYLKKELSLGNNLPLPLTVLYKKGKYVLHIRGAVPYEMLQTLIEQLENDPQTKE